MLNLSSSRSSFSIPKLRVLNTVLCFHMVKWLARCVTREGTTLKNFDYTKVSILISYLPVHTDLENTSNDLGNKLNQWNPKSIVGIKIYRIIPLERQLERSQFQSHCSVPDVSKWNELSEIFWPMLMKFCLILIYLGGTSRDLTQD